MGDDKWQSAQEQKEKVKKFSNELRNMNRKFGLMNNSPGGGKVENLTAKFGASVTLQPKPD